MRPFLLLAVALGALGLPGAASSQLSSHARIVKRGLQEASRVSTNNVLVLLADDVGVDMIGAYAEGSDLPPTPNIDALAADGVLFRNAWSNPVCSPTRACIQTGRYSFRHGIGFVVSPTGLGLRIEEHSIPEMLDQGSTMGYVHAAFGKWHLGNQYYGGRYAPNFAGYSHFSGTLRSLTHPETYYDWEHVVDGVATQETDYETTVVVDEAIAWIAAQDDPWFCYVAFNLPHAPYHRPPDTLHTVDFTGVDPNPSVEPRPYYKAMVEAMDTEIGRLLGSIDSTVLSQTTVIFLGDNGTPRDVTVAPFQSDHAKSTVFEGGVNVPFIVSGPYVQSPNSECQALVSAVDLYGTIADVANVDYETEYPNTTFDTVSVLPYLINPTQASLRSVAYTETFLPNGDGLPDPYDHLCQFVATPGPGSWADAIAQQLVLQENLGYQGPGTATLSIWGPELHETGMAKLRVQDGPPNAAGVLSWGDSANPVPFGGGIILPSGDPWLETRGMTTNANGGYSLDIEYIPGIEYVYYQAVIQDFGQPAGWAITNAVRARMAAGLRAVRNSQYKLIVDSYTCAESLFDLSTDPFEQSDLLLAPLSSGQQQNYDLLKAALESIINS
jgi:arylsulfatase A-like enzyme